MFVKKLYFDQKSSIAYPGEKSSYDDSDEIQLRDFPKLSEKIVSYESPLTMAEQLFTVNKTRPSMTDRLPEIYENDEDQKEMNILTFPNSTCSDGDFVSLVKSGHWLYFSNKIFFWINFQKKLSKNVFPIM